MLQCPRKPYFCYLTNTRTNYTPTFKGLPPPEHYLPNAMDAKKRKHFESKWYPAESRRRANEWFDVKKEAVTYCENDTLQLLFGIVLFRRLVNAVAKCDIFSKGITATSLCMRA